MDNEAVMYAKISFIGIIGFSITCLLSGFANFEQLNNNQYYIFGPLIVFGAFLQILGGYFSLKGKKPAHSSILFLFGFYWLAKFLAVLFQSTWILFREDKWPEMVYAYSRLLSLCYFLISFLYCGVFAIRKCGFLALILAVIAVVQFMNMFIKDENPPTKLMKAIGIMEYIASLLSFYVVINDVLKLNDGFSGIPPFNLCPCKECSDGRNCPLTPVNNTVTNI